MQADWSLLRSVRHMLKLPPAAKPEPTHVWETLTVCKPAAQHRMLSVPQRPHGVWQLRNGSCPATFTNNPTGGQKQLVAVTRECLGCALAPNHMLDFICIIALSNTSQLDF